MSSSKVRAARSSAPWTWPALLLLLGLSLVCQGGTATASATADVTRIEEDWQLIVSQPEPDAQAPQVTCAISPSGDVEGTHAVLDFNLRTQPDVEPGGMQIQVWQGQEPQGNSKSHSGTLLHHEDETVTWTTDMKLYDGWLRFKIKNGSSQSWGSFGNEGSLSVHTSSSLTNLNGYSSSVTVANSGVGFAANRVTSLKLLRVRAYSSSGELVGEDNTPKVVYSHE
jgi:hypothetical protein